MMEGGNVVGDGTTELEEVVREAIVIDTLVFPAIWQVVKDIEDKQGAGDINVGFVSG
ncbi:MAG: hypothetical protein AAF264_02580 [Pseudomonadota bacterium]